MASKSKKRRRVLGASCILAALIVAGSSFAWFTSKDEVTNRLTANADYGVSIVESFVPPQNWLPGQTVNKDVYAVNTGNVDAFVKETITGKLNYTYETVIDEFDEDGVTLDDTTVLAIDGATTHEAGGYLAYTSADYPTGPVNSARQDDPTNPTDTGVENPRWTPSADGIYIFRRAIDTSDAGTIADLEDPTKVKYTYAGYYFKKAASEDDEDKYYKIVIGDDSYPTDGQDVENDGEPYAEWNFDIYSNSLGGDAVIGKDGEVVSGTPKVRYVKEYEVVNADAVFTYNAGDDDNPATLSVNYVPANFSGTGNVDAARQAYEDAQGELEAAKAALTLAEGGKTAAERSSAAAIAERNYEDALGDYNSALSRYNQTKADFDYAVDLANATNNLYAAADARAIFQAKLKDAEDAKDDAWNDNDATDVDSVQEKASAMVDATDSGTYKDVINMGKLEDDSAVSFKSLFGIDTKDATTANTLGGRINTLASAYQSDSRFTSLKSNLNTMYDLWAEMQTLLNGTPASGEEGTEDYVAAVPGIIADLESLRDAVEPMTDAQVKTIRERLATNLKALKEKMKDYSDAYTNMSTTLAQVSDATLTQLADNAQADTLVSGVAVKAKNLYDVEFKTQNTGLEDLMKDYETKYKTWNDMNTGSADTDNTLAKANQDWADAISTYNNAVETALGSNTAVGSYKYDINQTQPELNNYYRLTGSAPNRKLKDQSALIIAEATAGVKKYVPNDANATTAKISTGAEYTAYTGTAAYDEDEDDYVVTGGKTATVPAATTFTQIDTADESGKKEAVNGSDDEFHAFTLSELDTAKDNKFKAVYGEDGTVNNPAENSLADIYADAKKAIQDVADAQANVTAAEGKVASTKIAYETALAGGSPVKIVINLAANEDELGWTYDNVNTDEGKEANFYLNKVLAAGETSAKLIDSVYLDKTTESRAYKTLVFDLNVGLDSVQVTYDADQREYETDAVDADDRFEMKATTTDGSADVSWAQPTNP